MPKIYPAPVAQRVRLPNGTTSAPFVVPMCRADMVRFATRVLDKSWPERFPDEPHRNHRGLTTKLMIDEMLAYRHAHDDFYSGSARLACAHDGRFWRTTEVWMRRASDYNMAVGGDGQAPNRQLTTGEVAILFARDDEFGWHSLGALGIVEPGRALARTVIDWATQIEEWSDPRTS